MATWPHLDIADMEWYLHGVHGLRVLNELIIIRILAFWQEIVERRGEVAAAVFQPSPESAHNYFLRTIKERG